MKHIMSLSLLINMLTGLLGIESMGAESDPTKTTKIDELYREIVDGKDFTDQHIVFYKGDQPCILNPNSDPTLDDLSDDLFDEINERFNLLSEMFPVCNPLDEEIIVQRITESTVEPVMGGVETEDGVIPVQAGVISDQLVPSQAGFFIGGAALVSWALPDEPLLLLGLGVISYWILVHHITTGEELPVLQTLRAKMGSPYDGQGGSYLERIQAKQDRGELLTLRERADLVADTELHRRGEPLLMAGAGQLRGDLLGGGGLARITDSGGFTDVAPALTTGEASLSVMQAGDVEPIVPVPVKGGGGTTKKSVTHTGGLVMKAHGEDGFAFAVDRGEWAIYPTVPADAKPGLTALWGAKQTAYIDGDGGLPWSNSEMGVTSLLMAPTAEAQGLFSDGLLRKQHGDRGIAPPTETATYTGGTGVFAASTLLRDWPVHVKFAETGQSRGVPIRWAHHLLKDWPVHYWSADSGYETTRLGPPLNLNMMNGRVKPLLEGKGNTVGGNTVEGSAKESEQPPNPNKTTEETTVEGLPRPQGRPVAPDWDDLN